MKRIIILFTLMLAAPLIINGCVTPTLTPKTTQNSPTQNPPTADTSITNPPVTKPTISPETFIYSSNVVYYSGAVGASQKITKKLKIDPISESLFFISTDSKDLVVILKDPAGRTIPSTVSYFNEDTEKYINMFEYKDVTFGEWSVELQNNSAKESNYNILVTGHSNILIDYEPTVKIRGIDKPLSISIFLSEGVSKTETKPLAGANIKAKIVDKGGFGDVVKEIILEDTGINEPRGRKYLSENSFDLPGGAYSVYLIIDGKKLDGTTFYRFGTIDQQYLMVTDDSAEILGFVDDSSQDLNSDGLIDVLYIDLDILVKEKGKYTLTGTLYNSEGQVVQGIAEPKDFTGSSSALNRANFAIEMRKSNDAALINGSFELREVQLFNENTDNWVDSWPESYKTKSYNVVK